MKLKKALSAVLALMLMVSGMSFTAFADGGTELIASNTTWEDGENLIVSDDLTINETVTVTGNVTLTISEGKTLIINGPDGNGGDNGLEISSGTLSVSGTGTLKAIGGNGTGVVDQPMYTGASGGSGIKIADNASLDVSNGTVEAIGGNGQSMSAANARGGEGGDGISDGTVTINGGSVTAIGGSAGSGPYSESAGLSIDHGKVTMTSGKLKVESIRVFSSGTSFSGGITNFEVSAEHLASGYWCVADTSVSGYTHRIEEIPVAAITNSKPEANKDTNNGYITVSAESATAGTEITVAAVPNEGYKVDSLTATYEDDNGTQNLTITDGKFIMPAYAVTVNAVFAEIQTSKIAGDNFDLDLETDTTNIPESTPVDQYYIKTTGEDTVYNNKILLVWSDEVMNIKVADAKKWNPSNLSWEVDNDKNGEATVDGDTNKKTITLTNYSAKAFTCSLTFAADDSVSGKYTSYSVDGTDVNLAAVTNNIAQPGQQLHTGDLPSASITATITPTLTGEGSFRGAAATTENTKYGTFTITCTLVNE